MPWIEPPGLPGGTMGPFTAGVQASLAPFNDQAGNLQTLLAAYGAMFDPVASIVTERGSPDGQLIGQTTAPILNTGPITNVTIGGALITVAAGQPVMIVAAGGTVWETFTAQLPVARGTPTVWVTSQTPRNNYPAGSFVQLGYAAGWSSVLDPDACPTAFLPYLGQYVGVQIAPNTSDADARAILRAESGFQRGTAASIIAAAKRYLIGTQSLFLLERTPNAYSFALVVRPEQDVNVTALTAAVDAVRPAGITWTLIQTDGWAIFQMEAFQATITLLEAQFVTITGLENDQPGA